MELNFLGLQLYDFFYLDKDFLKRAEGIKAGAKPFNREEAEKKAKEYHKKKGQFQEEPNRVGERGGLYEIRFSSRTGKPYRHYF